MSNYVQFRLRPDGNPQWAEVEGQDIKQGIFNIISGGQWLPIEILKIEQSDAASGTGKEGK